MRFKSWLPLMIAVAGAAQAPRSLVGTLAEIRSQSSEIAVRPDSGPAVVLKLAAGTAFLRIAPGEKDLRNAAPIAAAGLALGDRLLVTFDPETAEARRVVVMPAAEIARRNDADRQDWVRRGVAGVVASKSAGQITLRMRSFQGETQATVKVSETTKFRRYAPDSVKFADARPSALDEVAPGDQLRARGQKTGNLVLAEEVVFGAFVTRGGAITAVAPGEITIKDLDTGKPLIVKLTAGSQLKRMPSFPTPGAGGPPAAPDFSQLLERLPAANLQDLKPGETILVSSTRGASRNSITAIMLLANAEVLIRMAGIQAERSQPPGMMPGGSQNALSGGLNGLEMPAMIP